MSDRVRFWRNSLSRGVRELYDAAGWVGLVVLVLGVAAGITVPLVLNLSPWLTAVVLLGLFVVVMIEGTYRVWNEVYLQREAVLTEWDSARADIEVWFDALRYALDIRDIDPHYFITGPATMDVQIGLKIENSSAEYIRYEIESVSTVVAGRHSQDSWHGSRVAIIPPNRIVTLTPPRAVDVPSNWKHGSMSVTLIYGPASGPPRYRRRWECAVKALRAIDSSPGEISISVVLVNVPEVEDV